MALHLRVPHPAAAARAAAAAVLLVGLATACSGPEPSENEQAAKPEETTTHTHDGAVPIAVLTSFEDQFRAGHWEAACGFLTPEAQERLTQRVHSRDLVGKEAPCERAAAALADRDGHPARIQTFDVPLAMDEVTELTVHRVGGSIETVTLRAADATGSWLIDTHGDRPTGLIPASEPQQ